MSSPTRLRPLSSIELINEAFDLCKRSGAASLTIAATISIPTWMLFPLFSEHEALDIPLALGLLLGPLATHAALTKLQFERYLGMPFSITDAWSALARRIVPLLLTAGLAGVMLVIGAAALAFPAVILYVAFFFLCHTLMLEDCHYLRAIRRSWELANGNAGRVLLVSLLAGSPYVALTGFLYWIGSTTEPAARSDSQAVTLADNLTGGFVVGSLLAMLAPFPTALSVVCYVDQRVRKEGFDVEWMTRAAGIRPPSGEGG